MIRRLQRAWCLAFHSSVRGLWGSVYECRTCGERWPNPALDGPVKQLPPCVNVRRVDAPKIARVVKIARKQA